MTKNIIVTDENGDIIGSTYPKRAEGLVKNGRAEYVGDCEIRMKAAHAPTEDKTAEEQQMSKIIDFDPRRFGFDKSCRTNEGQRAFMTTALGNAEVWEIGGYDRHRTQLISKMKLQKHTEYVFRVAMTGGLSESCDEITLVTIFPENRWEERMNYALDKSRFEPVLSKRDRQGLLRAFELPFSTGDAEDWSIIILQERAPARFFRPLDNSAYASLTDMTYEQWLAENRKKRGFFGRETVKEPVFGGFDLSDTIIGSNALKKLLDMGREGFDVERVIEKAKSDIDNIIEQVKQEIDPDGSIFGAARSSAPDYVDNGDETAKRYTVGGDGLELTFADCEFDETGLAERLSGIGGGCNVSFNNVTVLPSADRSCVIIGSPTSGSNISFHGVTMTAYGLSMVMAKVGNGCNVKLTNVTITDDGLTEMIGGGTRCSGVNLEISGVTLPKRALDLIYSRMDDSCNISVKNISTAQERRKNESVGREETKSERKPKDESKKKSGDGYYFTDMLKSTFENAAEGFNTFGEFMRRAEEDFTDIVDELIGDKKDKPEPSEEEKDKADLDDSED